MKVRIVSLFLCAVAFAAVAAAQTKVAGTATCKADPPAPVAIGDKPDHAYSISKGQCTWSELEMAGSKAKDGVTVAVAEIRGNTTATHGYHMGTMENGDKWTCSVQGKSVSKDGKPVSDRGTWAFTDGTGKLKGLKGKGTFKGTPAADGTMTYKIEGEYSTP